MAPTKVLPASSETAAVKDHGEYGPPRLIMDFIMDGDGQSPMSVVDANVCDSRPSDGICI